MTYRLQIHTPTKLKVYINCKALHSLHHNCIATNPLYGGSE